MIVCNNCGHQNPDGNYICSNCGFVVNQKNKGNKPNVQRMRPVQQNQQPQQNFQQQPNTQQVQNNTPNMNGGNRQNINNQQMGNMNTNSNMYSQQSTQNNRQLNYGNNYNSNSAYTQQMYQQQAYGKVVTNSRKLNKKIYMLIAAVFIIIAIIIAMIGIKFVSKVLKAKQISTEQVEDEFIADNNGTQSSETSETYFSESQLIYNEYNVKVETNLSNAKVENGDITLRLDINNNTNTKLNFKVQGIMVNAMVGYNNCNDIISVESKESSEQYVFFDLDDTIQDPLYTIEFQLYVYSDDYSTIIVTDNCMIKDLTTNQPTILQAYTNLDESLVTAINENVISSEADNNENIDNEDTQDNVEVNTTIGNQYVGYFKVNENGWQVDSRYSDEGNTTDESVEHSYSAEYINGNIDKTLYVLNIDPLNGDLETEYTQLCEALDIPFEVKYETESSKVVYDVSYSNGTLTLTALILDSVNTDIITILYQESGTERNEFLISANNIMKSYTKCDIHDINIE